MREWRNRQHRNRARPVDEEARLRWRSGQNCSAHQAEKAILGTARVSRSASASPYKSRSAEILQTKLNMREWRNRQTRTFEGRVGRLVRVQVPSLAPSLLANMATMLKSPCKSRTFSVFKAIFEPYFPWQQFGNFRGLSGFEPTTIKYIHNSDRIFKNTS